MIILIIILVNDNVALYLVLYALYHSLLLKNYKCLLKKKLFQNM